MTPLPYLVAENSRWLCALLAGAVLYHAILWLLKPDLCPKCQGVTRSYPVGWKASVIELRCLRCDHRWFV